MHPVLIEFGPFALYSYGFFIAAAFLLGMAWTMREAETKGLDHRYVLDLGFYALVGGLAGARLAYAAANPEIFLQDPLNFFKFWKGGLIFWGGVLFAALLMALFLLRKKQKILTWFDAAVPGTALALSVGWLGCLASGCAYGKPASLPWSVTFTHPDAIGPLFMAMHPVQAYHALAALLFFALALLFKSKIQVSGRLAGVFLITYPTVRFLLDLFRNDIQSDPGIMAVSRILGVAFFFLGIMLIRPLSSGN